jgi:hypothetical protein
MHYQDTYRGCAFEFDTVDAGGGWFTVRSVKITWGDGKVEQWQPGAATESKDEPGLAASVKARAQVHIHAHTWPS